MPERLPVSPLAAVIATNLEGRVAYWDAGAERLYGWSEAEAIGADILALTPANYTRDQSEAIMRGLRRGEPWEGEIVLRRRNGVALIAYVLDIPVGDFEQGQGAVIGVSAPTEARGLIVGQAERLRAALAPCFT